MEDTSELTEIKRHLNGLMEQIREINSLINLIINIGENMEDYLAISKKAPFFFGYGLNSLYRSLIIETYNLFDTNRKDSRYSLHILLDKIKLNLNNIEKNEISKDNLLEALKTHELRIVGNEKINEIIKERENIVKIIKEYKKNLNKRENNLSEKRLKAKENIKIMLQKIKIKKDQLNKDEIKIKKDLETMKKNIQLRSNFFAHWQTPFLDDPVEIAKKYSILISDEQKLVQTGKEILAFWCKQLSCSNCEIGTYEAGDFIRLIKKINTDKNLE